jgi:type III pantothenate kinase
MNMNLTIDIGNTSVKIALFDNGKIIKTRTYEEFTFRQLNSLNNEYKFRNVILSSVISNDFLIKVLRLDLYNFVELTYKTPLPIKNLYKSPETLGNDRIAAVTGANKIFPGNTVLVIDAGTAITYDIITGNAEYAGGNISPGMTMRFKALNILTDKLPLLNKSDKFYNFGDTTEDAIVSGVQKGIIYEIEGYIKEAGEKYNDLEVILTGGDANFFDKMLKKRIFVEPNLIFIGLNTILEHNVRNK